MPAHSSVTTDHTPDHYSQSLAVGNFYILISTNNPQTGHDLITKIEESINENPTASPQDITKTFSDFDILAAKIEDNKLSLSSPPNLHAIILRDNKIINLTGIISGPLKNLDLIIFSNQPVPAKFITPDIADTLAVNLESQNIQNFTALIIKNELEKPQFTLSHPPLTAIRSTLSAPRLPNRRLFYLVVIFFVFLASIITFQLRGKAIETRTQTVAQIEKQVNDGLASAQKLIGLNDVLARNILLQTKTDFDTKTVSSFGQNWSSQKTSETQKLLKISKNLDSQISLVSHIYPISQLDTFYDFSLLKQNAQIISAEIHNGEIIALDQNNGAVYSLQVENKSAKIVTGSDTFKSAKYIDFSGDKIYVFSTDGISQSNKNIIKPTANWSNIQSLKTFGNNLYLLSPNDNQIYKFISTDFGFSDIQNYLKTGLSLDLKNVVSMAIDGNIYVLSKTGSLVRFTSGSTDEFQIIGLDKPLNNPVSLYTSDETQNIYILDTDRIVVLDKKGTYIAQYTLPKTEANQILVSETAKKIFLINKNIVYSLSLRA